MGLMKCLTGSGVVYSQRKIHVNSGDYIWESVGSYTKNDPMYVNATLPPGKYHTREYDVSDVSAIVFTYSANSTYNNTAYANLGYALDGVETQITDYTNSTVRTVSIDVSNVNTFWLYGNIADSSGAGGRDIFGWLKFI